MPERVCGFDPLPGHSLEGLADSWRRHPFGRRASESLAGSTPVPSVMKNRIELASWKGNLCVRLYRYKGKLIEVWWGRERDQWEVVLAYPGGEMFPMGSLPIIDVRGQEEVLDVLIENGICTNEPA